MLNYKIKIVQGIKAKQYLSDKEFLIKWKKLANDSGKCTIIQEPPFVLTWYKQYSAKFTPVLVLGIDDEDNLLGFLPLSLENVTNQLIHTGSWQAEYHGWIAHPDIDESFPIQAIIAIQNNFQIKKWQWRWMPPNFSINWINSPLLHKNNIFIKVKFENSPLWDLTDRKKENKIFANKSIKSKINRYKKRGELYLERITNKNRAELLLAELKHQCDFRQMSINGITPFRQDPFKESFFIEKLNYPESFHFTVLWCDEKPLAFHHGPCDNNTIYIGLSGFDPTEYKNSPGTLLMALLAKFARSEGYKYIDLTPGGDAYKQRFSNSVTALYMPMIYFNTIDKLKDEFICILKFYAKSLLTMGGRSEKFITFIREINIKDFQNKLKRITFGKVARKFIYLFYNNRVYLRYRLKKEDFTFKNNTSIKVNKQKYADLLEYSGSNPWKSKQEIVSGALDRFANGETLYSIMIDNLLAHWGWLTKGGKTHFFTEVDMTCDSLPNTYILYDFYTEPKYRRKKLYLINMIEMINDSFENGADEVFIGVRRDNFPSRKAIEKVGFKLYQTFINRRILFYSKKISF